MSSLSFANVSMDEAVQRARELVPALRERADKAEKARIVLPETMEDLNRLGLLRILQPKRWGGMELDFVSCFDVVYELGRGCASTSWTAANLLIHHWMLGLYDDQAQADVWETNPDAGIASGVATAQGQGRPVDGGYMVSGHWNFSSGVNVSDWNMLAATIKDGDKVVDYRLCLLHKSEYEVIDDWQVMGMRSTGSMTVDAKDVFVPEHRALSMYDLRGGSSHPGAKTNPGPLFRVALSMISGHVIAATLVGNAQAALELTSDTIREKSSKYTAMKIRDVQAVQIKVASAAAKIDAARQLIRAEYVESQDYANRNYDPDLETRLRFKRNVAYAVSLCTEAVETLHILGGAHGIYDGPMQRIFRDAHSGARHIMFASDMHFSAWGLAYLGGDIANPLL